MSSFIIQGKKKLSGEISIAGRKNAALPLLAASLLTKGECEFSRIPDIGDIQAMLAILVKMGAKVKRNQDRVWIKTDSIKTAQMPTELTRKLRASILFLGPLLARFGEFQMPHPGGCVIGKRPIGTHMDGLRALGATIVQDQEYYLGKSDRKGLNGQSFYLKEASVTATETAIMAAVLASGKTVIHNVATEPHIVQLAQFLNSLDYTITGAGTNQITIYGRKDLSSRNGKISVIPDDLEIGTFACLSALLPGKIILRDCGLKNYLLPILQKMEDFNISYRIMEKSENCDIEISRSINLRASLVQTGPWPAFPTDLQPPFAVLATQANGTSLIHDWMYEGRLYYTDTLQKMGANITICDPHRALISGPTPLFGSSIISPDIRAGAALLIAALIAEGETKIDNIELIDRGYENIDARLRSLGAGIKRGN